MSLPMQPALAEHPLSTRPRGHNNALAPIRSFLCTKVTECQPIVVLSWGHWAGGEMVFLGVLITSWGLKRSEAGGPQSRPFLEDLGPSCAAPVRGTGVGHGPGCGGLWKHAAQASAEQVAPQQPSSCSYAYVPEGRTEAPTLSTIAPGVG